MNSKHILITGGAGFLGHHVIEYFLKNTNWNITSLDRLDYSGNLNRLGDIISSEDNMKRVNVVFHDLKAELNPLTKNFIHKHGEPDIILHLAAASHVDRSISFPLEFVHDNILGTAHILEYARTIKNLESFFYFSTDEVFGIAPLGVNYKERDRYNSTNPYSASKAAGEELCVAYENTYKLPVIITHTMNLVGERQTPEKFVPLCIRKVLHNEKILIHSDSTKKVPGSRFYIHAKEVADAIHFLLVNKPLVIPDYGGAKCPKFNIVGKEEIDNLELAMMIAKAQDKELNYEMVDFHSSRPGHDLRYSLSGELMKSLGWEPKTPINMRIKEISDWYLNNKRWLEL